MLLLTALLLLLLVSCSADMVESTTVLLIVVTTLTAFFVWSRRTYVYWQRRGIKFVQPTHLLGNLKDVLRLQTSFALQLRDFYFDKRFENEPVVGIYLFHQPALLLRDLDIIRTVLIEDFVSFSDRFAKCDHHFDKLGALNLYFAKNPEWREIRTKLSPAFNTARIKQMFALMEEIGYDLETYLNKLTATSDRGMAVIQIKELCDRYTTDMITSIAFGFRSYSLRNTLSDLGVHTRQMFRVSFKRMVDCCLIFFLPKLVTLLHPKIFTAEHANFLRYTVRQVITEREGSGNMRNDFVEILLTLKKEADLNPNDTHFTHRKDYLPAQAAIFQVAGIETTASTLAFALYELAKQPALQEKLCKEIRKLFHDSNDGLTYDKVYDLEYLNMVVDEILRLYPIVPFLERVCTPINKKRFYSFRPHMVCFARRGMPVFISNLAIHHDPAYWPNPDTFDPERFSSINKSLHKPMSYLPFGAGPHGCIGTTLAKLQIKLGLIHFLRHHRVEICEKTVENIKFDPKFVLLSPEGGGIYLRVVKCI